MTAKRWAIVKSLSLSVIGGLLTYTIIQQLEKNKTAKNVEQEKKVIHDDFISPYQ